MAAHPKFYFFDTGLYRKLRPSGPLDRSEEIGGVALEGLVYQHIKAFLDNQSVDAKLFFWRTKSGSEVDFITYGNDSFCAVEVKSSGNLRPKDFNGLKAFGEDYPMSKRMMVYMGKTKFMKDDILVIPAEEFIKNVNVVLM